MKEVSIKIKCNGCGREIGEHERANGAQVDLLLTIQRDARKVDVCQECWSTLVTLWGSGEKVDKPKPKSKPGPKPRRAPIGDVTYPCNVKGCKEKFGSKHGLGMHRVRGHGLPFFEEDAA